MDNSFFQNVFDKIVDFLPADWHKAVFFAGFTSGSYSMKFYTRTEHSEYIDCFKLPGISKPELVKSFVKINQIIAKERSKLDAKKKWTIFTMLVDSDGSMKTEFDYADHSEDMISFEKEWKKKYLQQ